MIRPRTAGTTWATVFLVGFLIGLWAAMATEDQAFSVPAPFESQVTVDLRDDIEPVNRRVMGVCLIYPPFDEQFVRLFRGVLDGTSGRAWANLRWEEKKIHEAAWSSFLPFARKVGINEIGAFNPNSYLGHPARYRSPEDNNLRPKHQPNALAQQIRIINRTAHPGFPKGYGITGWEVWNEPQFPQNGAWPAEDYARYILDCSHAIHASDPSIEIGAGLHESDMRWNRRVLSYIAARDITALDYVVTHPYDFYWISARRKMGTYYARVSGAEMLRLRLREKVRLTQQIGHGRWRVVASEWNTHPIGYGPPYHISTDMAVAIHMAAMFGVFWDEMVDSAQFFHLACRKTGHFGLVRRTASGLKLMPTGHVLRLYGRYFRGTRLRVRAKVPTYPYSIPGAAPLAVPVVFCHAAYDRHANRLVLILANRHEDAAAPVEIHLRHFRPTVGKATRVTITTSEPESAKCKETQDELVRLPSGSDPSFRIELPAHSVVGLLIAGVIPPTESELFSQRMLFVHEWQVSDVRKPKTTGKHGLAELFPAKALSKRHLLKADSTGFVNIASLLEVTGEALALKEGCQAITTSWVFSPVAREIGISLGLDYWGILKVNGNEVLSVVERGGPPRPDTHRCNVRLRAGWNRLDVRVASGSKGMGFWLAVENTGDLRFSSALQQPPWPRQWQIAAEKGADVNRFKKARDVPRPDGKALELSGVPGVFRRAFVQWPTVVLPSEGFRVSAQIVLTHAYHRGRGTVRIRPVLASWKEATLCWNRQPTLGPPLPQQADIADKEWVFAGKEVDALVQKWIADPSTNFGVAVEMSGREYAAFCSDDQPDCAPKLVLRRKQ